MDNVTMNQINEQKELANEISEALSGTTQAEMAM